MIVYAVIAQVLLLITLLVFVIVALVESLVMSLKGYKYNSGWGRWEKSPTRTVFFEKEET